MNQQTTSAPVPNYLVGSILATLFCCLPTGIASIVFASRANSKAAIGDIAGALADASKAKTWLWISVIPGFLIPVIGILAAIALPAYQDYTSRAKVAEAMVAASSVRTGYTEFVAEHHAWPSAENLTELSAAQAPGKHSIDIDAEHNIEITLEGKGDIAGKTILLVPQVSDSTIAGWTCTAGTMPAKYLPASCRH